MTTTNQIQIYTSADGKAELQVTFEKDTLWLSQAQATTEGCSVVPCLTRGRKRSFR